MQKGSRCTWQTSKFHNCIYSIHGSHVLVMFSASGQKMHGGLFMQNEQVVTSSDYYFVPDQTHPFQRVDEETEPLPE